MNTHPDFTENEQELALPPSAPPPYTPNPPPECHSVFLISEILNVTLSHLSSPDLARCLQVNRHWFILAAAHLWRNIPMSSILQLTDTGRNISKRRRTYDYAFPLSVSCVRRLLIYTPFVATIAYTHHQHTNYHFKSHLDLTFDFLYAWAALAASNPSLVVDPTSSNSSSIRNSDIHLNRLFPRLRFLRGNIIHRKQKCIFSLPYIPALGLVEPFQAVYSTTHSLIDTHKLLAIRAHSLCINARNLDPKFFSLVHKSRTIKELDITLSSVDISNIRDWHDSDHSDAEEGSADDGLDDARPTLTHLTLRSPRPLPLLLALLEAMPALSRITDLHLQNIVFNDIPPLLYISDSDDSETDEVSTDFDSFDGGGGLMGFISDWDEEEESGFVSAGSGSEDELENLAAADSGSSNYGGGSLEGMPPLLIAGEDTDSNSENGADEDGDDASSLFSTASSASHHSNDIPLLSPQSISPATPASLLPPPSLSDPINDPSHPGEAPPQNTTNQLFRAALERFVHLRRVRLSSRTDGEDGTRGVESGEDFLGGRARMVDGIMKVLDGAGDEWGWQW